MTVYDCENVTPPETGEKKEFFYRATFCARPVIAHGRENLLRQIVEIPAVRQKSRGPRGALFDAAVSEKG